MTDSFKEGMIATIISTILLAWFIFAARNCTQNITVRSETRQHAVAQDIDNTTVIDDAIDEMTPK